MSKLCSSYALLLCAVSFAACFLAALPVGAQLPYASMRSFFDPSPAGALEERFGTSVATEGRHIVIGATLNDTGTTNAGCVYVYDLDSLTPTVPMLVLTNPSPARSDLFGYSVGISGTRVVVGARYDATGANQAGSAYVYDLTSAIPAIPILTLTNPTPESADQFSQSVSISGSRLVIGAPKDRVGSTSVGSVYVYDLARPSPATPVVNLINPSSMPSPGFGRSVAISGTRIVVGALQNDFANLFAGAAYVYDLSNPSPAVPVRILNNPNPGPAGQFGIAVGISGTRAVVGADGDDTGATDAGIAYVFNVAAGGSSFPIATLTNPSPGSVDFFGTTVAISGTRVVIGAYGDDTGATDAGSAYVYDLTSSTPSVPIVTLNNPTPDDTDRFGYSIAIDGATVIAGTPFDDTTGTNRGVVYAFNLVPTLRIAPAAPGLATLSWSPASLPGFLLQYADALMPTNWLNAPSGETNPVTLSLTNSARFYRLREL